MPKPPSGALLADQQPQTDLPREAASIGSGSSGSDGATLNQGPMSEVKGLATEREFSTELGYATALSR
jgi:hypothetical protein